MRDEQPELSVILIVPDAYSVVARTVRHLILQTIRDRIELVVVTASGLPDDFEPDHFTMFQSYSVVEIGRIRSTGSARAAGIRVARAPFVAFTEEHSFTHPTWAEALLATLRQGFAAAGPELGNSNPASALSWANLLSEYGQWMARPRDESIDHIPGHNGGYRRDLLLATGARLDAFLDAESTLHWHWKSQGHRLCLEPAARTDHLNVSRLRPTLRLRLLSGRLFAAERARGWSLEQRLLYLLGSPLIPFVRFRRLLRDAARVRRAGARLPHGTLPTAFLTLTVESLGEALGYATGNAEGTLPELTAIEFNRHRYLNAADRAALEHAYGEVGAPRP